MKENIESSELVNFATAISKMHVVDLMLISGFLLLTFLLGMAHGKKVKSLRDYALGSREFSTFALSATMIATYGSSSALIITWQRIYTDGFFYMVSSSCIGICLILIAVFIVPRMGEFLGTISIADAFGGLYGNKVRYITASTGIIDAVGYIAAQFMVLGATISTVFDLKPEVSITIAGGLVTLYSAFGGIRAVTFTDVIQLFAFGAIIPLLSVIIWDFLFVSHPEFDLYIAISDPKYNLFQIFSFDNPDFLNMLTLACIFLIPNFSPAIAQRMFIAKNLGQLQKVLIYSGIALIVIKFLSSWIGFLLYQEDASVTDGDVVKLMMSKYTYIGLKGALTIAVLAMAMSTADSYINSSSVLFAHDICKVFRFTDRYQLLIAKLFAGLLGIFSIILCFYSENNLLKLVLTMGASYYMIVSSPAIVTFLGFRSKTATILSGMFAGLLFLILWKYIFKIDIQPITLGMLVNFIVMMIVHYTFFRNDEKLGWGQYENKEFLIAQNEAIRDFFTSCKEQILDVFHPKNWTKENLKAIYLSKIPTEDTGYFILGSYAVLTIMPTLYNSKTMGFKLLLLIGTG